MICVLVYQSINITTDFQWPTSQPGKVAASHAHPDRADRAGLLKHLF